MNGGVFLREEVPNLKLRIQANLVKTYDLWHGWLGHPSRQVLSLLAKDLNFELGNKANELCGVCFHAKQTHCSFSQSESNDSENFGLIHCDIWGAYRILLVVHTIF